MKSGLSSKDLTKAILLLAGGVLLVPALAASPGLGYALKPFLKNYYPSKINRAVKRLHEQKLISITEKKDETIIELSEKGKRKILSYKLEEMELKIGKWDGWWRMVIFDIPEKNRRGRDYFRSQLKYLNFYLLQESVLVTPWRCRDEVDFVKHLYGVDRHVQLIMAKHFDGEEKVRNYFRV